MSPYDDNWAEDTAKSLEHYTAYLFDRCISLPFATLPINLFVKAPKVKEAFDTTALNMLLIRMESEEPAMVRGFMQSIVNVWFANNSLCDWDLMEDKPKRSAADKNLRVFRVMSPKYCADSGEFNVHGLGTALAAMTLGIRREIQDQLAKEYKEIHVGIPQVEFTRDGPLLEMFAWTNVREVFKKDYNQQEN
jgi:hypothetical protein